MLVSSGQGIMRLEVTYGFLESHMLFVSAVWGAVCFRQQIVQFFHFFSLSFPPSLIGGFGKYWVGKYLHWPGQCDSAWWVVAAYRVAVDACVPCSGLLAQGSLLALESRPTLTGTISKLIYWQWVKTWNNRQSDMSAWTALEYFGWHSWCYGCVIMYLLWT